jgi:hypothetical protein
VKGVTGGIAAAAAALVVGASAAAAPLVTAQVNGVAIGHLLPEASGPYVDLAAVARQLGYEVHRIGPDAVNLQRPGALNPPPILTAPADLVLTPTDLTGYSLGQSAEESNATLEAENPGIETAIQDEGRLDGAAWIFDASTAQLEHYGGPSQVEIALNEFSTWAGASMAVNAFAIELRGLKGSVHVENGRLGTVGDTSTAYAVLSTQNKAPVRTVYLVARVNNWELIVIAAGGAKTFYARSVWPIALLQAGKVAAMGGSPIE